MAYNLGGVVSETFTFIDALFTYFVSGCTIADVGSAMTQDTTTASTMRKAGAQEPILGRLETFEDRVVLGVKVGTVSREFKCKLPAAVGHTIVLGNSVSGSAVLGQVVPTTSQAEPKMNRVVEVGVDYVVVESL
jgi:hypothetical protein